MAHEKLKGENQQTVERKVLLEEEVRWLKAQYYGRFTQATDAAEQNPDQAMLFNEAEVLAAIEAADEAHRERTTKINAQKAMPLRKPSAITDRDGIRLLLRKTDGITAQVCAIIAQSAEIAIVNGAESIDLGLLQHVSDRQHLQPH